MADSLQPETAGNMSSESKLQQHGISAESVASSLSYSSNNRSVFAANRFNLLRWTTAHKFITEYCDVQLHHPMNSNSPELYDSLEDMIQDVFAGDLLSRGQTLLKRDSGKLCTDIRLRSLKEDWLNDFHFVQTLDSSKSSVYGSRWREQLRLNHLVQTVSVKQKISEFSLIDRSQGEAILLNKMGEFIDSYLYLLLSNQTSEDAYKKCFEKFLGALFLQFLSPPPTCKRWQYLRPAIAWSHSGKTVAEPDGTVITQKCLLNLISNAFAYIQVKKETQYKGENAERCLKEKEARPKLPWHHIQEVLHEVLPQHFLELLLSANDTVFISFKKKGSGLQKIFTKVGLIQQGMMVNVVILKIREDDFWWLVPGEEKGKKLHKDYEASKRSRDCPEATENAPNEEDPRPESENSNEAFSSESDVQKEDDLTFLEEEIDNYDIAKEKRFVRSLRSTRSQKKVRFEYLDHDDDCSSGKKHPLLYISKTYSLLNNQERIHLANGLLVLEAIADDIVSDIVQN